MKRTEIAGFSKVSFVWKRVVEYVRRVARRSTIVVELSCIVVGVVLACFSDPKGLIYALSSGGAASAVVALLLDIRAALEGYNLERRIILNFDKMISPLICRWVEMYIYMSDKDKVNASKVSARVNGADRCGVDLMTESFNLDGMVNMFDHPYLFRQPLNVPVLKLFAEADKMLNDEVYRFLISNALDNFKSIAKALSGMIECTRTYDTLQHILGDETLTIGGKTVWNLFKEQASALVLQFPPNGQGNPMWNHYYWFMVRIQGVRKLLIAYENEIGALHK